MTKSKHHEEKTSWPLALAFVLLLIAGMVISLIQIQNSNTIRSRGETPAIINCTVDNSKLAISPGEQELLDKINNHRAQYGLSPLVWSADLIRASAWKSNDMIKSGTLSHTDSFNRDTQKRITDCGYNDSASFGENIDSGTPDSKITFEAWSHSPPQNSNLLNGDFKEVGIALESDTSRNLYYWTFNAGSKKTITPTNPVPTPTLTPTSSPLPPTGFITPTKIPTQTPVPTQKPEPTKVTTPVPAPKTVYPVLKKVDPDIAYSGSKVIVAGVGGYEKSWDGNIIKNPLGFQLYFDGLPNRRITCYDNICKGEVIIPSGIIGMHEISVEGGSKLNINIIKPVPTGVPATPVVPTPTTPPDYVPNPGDMQLFVTAKITGIGNGGNKNPRHLTRHVTVGIYGMDNQIVTEGNGFIIYDRNNLFRGVIHFGPVPKGTYFVKILSDHMLQETVRPTFQALDSSRLNILPDVTLLQGDIDDDNKIDIIDYNASLGCFQNKRCQDKELIDFNDDGVSNVVDYNILLHDYWEALGD